MDRHLACTRPGFPRDEQPLSGIQPSAARHPVKTMNALHHAVRMLLQNPAFATVVVVSLALGIAANTAVFSLLNALQLCSLPVREPGQLRLLNWTGPLPREYSIAGHEFIYLRKGGRWFGSHPILIQKD
jgi:hypothetical protein